MVTSVEKLAREIEAIRRQIGARSPGLTHSAIDGGAIVITDGVGGTTGSVGVQYDGSSGAFSLNGPTPPVPTAPIVEEVPGGIKVGWDGFFAGEGIVVATMDWVRVDVEVSTNSAFPEFDDPLRPVQGSIMSAAGGYVNVPWGTVTANVYVRLRSRSLTGKRSAPSGSVGPVSTGAAGSGGPLNAVAPKPPTGVTVTTSAALDNVGNDVAVLEISWTPPTQNTDNSTLTDLFQHNVQYKKTGTTAWTSTAVSGNSVVVPVLRATSYDVRVQAIDSDGMASTWVTPAAVTSAATTTLPPTPSTPSVSNYMGQLKITWNGLDTGGSSMPVNFDRLDVHVSTTSTFTPGTGTLVAQMNAAGTIYAATPYTVTQYVKFVAVNKQGISSAASTAASGSTTQVVEADIFDGAVGTSKLAALAVTTAKINLLAVNDAQIGNLDVGKLVAGTMSADVVLSGRFKTATSGTRTEFDSAGIRLYSGASLTVNWSTSTGRLTLYNTTDASHTSTGHAIQFGDTTSANLIIDSNEIMTRNNGGYSPLYLNREGGQVHIGGAIGGITGGAVPSSANQQVIVNASLQVWNSQSGDYADEFPPFMVGLPSGQHLWFDGDAIGSSDTGDSPGLIRINPPAIGPVHHTNDIYVGSNSGAIRRYGTYPTTKSSLYHGLDGVDAGVRLMGSSTTPRVIITDTLGSTLRQLEASNVALSSARATKRNVQTMPNALDWVLAAPATRWQYIDSIEKGNSWHHGPMAEDLPPELLAREGDPNAEDEIGRHATVSLGSEVGVLWEAVRLLAAEVRRRPTP